LEKEDHLIFWKIEDDLNYFVNGRLPDFFVNGTPLQFFCKWNTTSIFSRMEDDLNLRKMEDDNLIFYSNGNRSQAEVIV
jgi:hypothetical protein